MAGINDAPLGVRIPVPRFPRLCTHPMGAAVVGMLATGTDAASFVSAMGADAHAVPGATLVLGGGIALVTLLILGMALLSSRVSRRFSDRRPSSRPVPSTTMPCSATTPTPSIRSTRMDAS